MGDHLDPDGRMRQGCARDNVHAISLFCRLGLEKFFADGNRVKNLTDRDRSAGWTACVRDFFDPSGRNDHPCAGQRLLFFCYDFDPGNGGNAGKRFPSESEGLDPVDIIKIIYFTRGIALKGFRNIGLFDALTIIRYPDGTTPASDQFNADICGTGVQRIFQKFFNNGSRSFNDFSGSNFIG